MLKPEIGKFLACLDLKPAPVYREGWVVCSCPLAPYRHKKGTDATPSFGVRIEQGESFVHCFSCDFHGSQMDLLMQLGQLVKGTGHGFDLKGAMEMVAKAEEEAPLVLGDDSPDLVTLVEQGRHEHVFPEWWLDSFDVAYYLGSLHPYITARGVPYPVAEALDLRFDGYRNRVCFPVRDFKGRLRGLHGRSVKDPPDTPTYLMYLHENVNNPEVWLGEHWVDLDRPVVFAESVFDLARIRQVYDNVVSPLTASLSVEKIRRMSAPEVVLLFDPDPAGRKASEKVKKILKDSLVHDLVLPDGLDAGDTSPYVLAKLLQDIAPVDKIIV